LPIPVHNDFGNAFEWRKIRRIYHAWFQAVDACTGMTPDNTFGSLIPIPTNLGENFDLACVKSPHFCPNSPEGLCIDLDKIKDSPGALHSIPTNEFIV
jgi:hypothetical protein